MRPVEYKTEDIIKAGLELQAEGLKVSSFSLRQKVGGGNPKRLEQVWDEYLTSQADIKVEPTTELPREITEAVRGVAKSLDEHLLALAIQLNDKAVKAADRRAKEAIHSANAQREQAERELADALQIVDDRETQIDELKINAGKLEQKLVEALADNQSKTTELANLQQALALAEQTANVVSEQYAAEPERLRNELIEQKQTVVTLPSYFNKQKMADILRQSGYEVSDKPINRP